jgi:magnesium chelatase subunit I
VFTANPEDYTARGKIITPLKDRIGNPHALSLDAPQRDRQHQAEAWTDRLDARRPDS